MANVQKWSIEGQWFDVCRCAIPCPCSWAQPPDDGFCEGILVWHIQKGHYGNVKLDGLNVAMLGSFRGNVWEKSSDFKDAIFMDERADAFGFKWNRTGKSSKLIAFEWSGPD